MILRQPLQLLDDDGNNTTAFGQDLVDFLHSPPVFALLYETATWTAGGCVALAKAMCDWTNNHAELIAWCRDDSDGDADHISVRIHVAGNAVYLDGFGLYGEADFANVSRMLLPRARYLPPAIFTVSRIDLSELNRQQDETMIGVCWIADNYSVLSDKLKQHFGRFEPDMIAMCLPDDIALAPLPEPDRPPVKRLRCS